MTFEQRHSQRRSTIEVRVGELGIGSMHPIRVQSMTTTNTMDTQATIDQSIRMIEAGCELVRITAPSIREAKNLEAIRDGLRARGYSTPLVADIHFTPNAAEISARIVEKVRVNPGNYADKKQFALIEYDDATYAAEIERIYQRFVPLVRICKEYGTAMRIGTNHGSLSDRIVNRFGDNPAGMVESALEFIRIAEAESYYNIVVSMKSSNPVVMVHAYRLLIDRLQEDGLKEYPLHLGVTEAGDGEDGRIKSAVGIGTLLQDGIGDTIRVSLTEEPEAEVPVARSLAERVYHRNPDHLGNPSVQSYRNSYHHRATDPVASIGGENVPRVFVELTSASTMRMSDLSAYGHVYDETTDKWNTLDQAAEFFLVDSATLPFTAPAGTRQIMHQRAWQDHNDQLFCVPCFTVAEYLGDTKRHVAMNVVRCDTTELSDMFVSSCSNDHTLVLLLKSSAPATYTDLRAAFRRLESAGVKAPVVVEYYTNNTDRTNATLCISSDIGAVFVDGYGNGIALISEPNLPSADLSLAFGILQATRTRMSKTEYISCPSCGRTLFDLQETTALIRSQTDHLKSVKIGIMGCIVNGPGEMADADYGYVGSGPDRITLYRGQTIVKRNVPMSKAVDELIGIMKDDGKWTDRQSIGGTGI